MNGDSVSGGFFVFVLPFTYVAAILSKYSFPYLRALNAFSSSSLNSIPHPHFEIPWDDDNDIGMGYNNHHERSAQHPYLPPLKTRNHHTHVSTLWWNRSLPRWTYPLLCAEWELIEEWLLLSKDEKRLTINRSTDTEVATIYAVHFICKLHADMIINMKSDAFSVSYRIIVFVHSEHKFVVGW